MSDRHLLLTEIFPPRCGGSGRWFWEIYRRLPRSAVVIAAGQEPRAEAFDRTHDLNVVRLPLAMPQWGLRSRAGLSGYWRVARAVWQLLRSHGIQQLHCGRCLPEGWVAWCIHQMTGLPYVCYVHGEELNTASQSREYRWMVRRVFAGADYVIANSRNTTRVLQDAWGLAEHRVRQLYPGVDADRFVPAARNRDVRARLGWNERPVVLTVGRLQKRKGHDQLILALRQIRQALPDVLYAIVGDGEERASLLELVARERLEPHVQFLSEIGDPLLLQCYQQCDLFVLPNREVDGDFEGFGMVLVEAQACGKPVLAGRSGGTAETMRIPETGWVVPCDGPNELASAVVELLSDAVRREHMGRAARRWAEAQFDWSSLSRQARQIFANGEESGSSGHDGADSIGTIGVSSDAWRIDGVDRRPAALVPVSVERAG